MQHQLAVVQSAAAGSDLRAAATQTTFLRNVLVRVPEYRLSLKAIKAAPGEEAEPFTRFLRLESPDFKPAPADTALTFNSQPIANQGGGGWKWIGAVPLGSAGAPAVAVANGHEVRLSSGAKFTFPGGASGVPPLPEGIVPLDFNYDFKTDLVLAGAGGVRLLAQDGPTSFRDMTAQTKLPKSVTNAPYSGAWAVDIEADGDLDIVLGASAASRRFCETTAMEHSCRFILSKEFRACAVLPGLISMATAIPTPRSSTERPASCLHERAAGPVPRASAPRRICLPSKLLRWRMLTMTACSICWQYRRTAPSFESPTRTKGRVGRLPKLPEFRTRRNILPVK